MSRQFGTNIDLLLNQLLNAKAQVLSSDPVSPQEGQFWYNSTTQTLKYRTATTTISLGQVDLSGYAPLASPVFTGDPTRTTDPDSSDNDQSIPTTAWVRSRIADLVASSPATLDTLNELAAALANDPNFATTITSSIATKAGKFTAAVGDGVATSIVVTHNLGTRSVVVSVHDSVTFDEIVVDVQKTTTNTVTLGFAAAPTASSRIVTVIG